MSPFPKPTRAAVSKAVGATTCGQLLNPKHLLRDTLQRHGLCISPEGEALLKRQNPNMKVLLLLMAYGESLVEAIPSTSNSKEEYNDHTI